MAKVKAYPKGSVESVEWTIGPDIDVDEVGGNLINTAGGGFVSVPTTTGWVLINPSSYAALEIIVG